VLAPGCDVPSHAHPNEQFAIVLSGKARFCLGEPGSPGYRELVVEGSPEGTVLHLPPNAPHSCHAIERCVILDVFSPPSKTTGIDRD
jgi:quercetin dioxygenase-like cupin family protein